MSLESIIMAKLIKSRKETAMFKITNILERCELVGKSLSDLHQRMTALFQLIERTQSDKLSEKEKPQLGYPFNKVYEMNQAIPADNVSERLKIPFPPYDFGGNVDCDICGCMIKKSLAIKGESRIVKAKTCKEGYPVEEKIVTPYYCKRCNIDRPTVCGKSLADLIHGKEIEIGRDYFFDQSVRQRTAHKKKGKSHGSK